jgi:5'(3')-deoxyribonucleotidase
MIIAFDSDDVLFDLNGKIVDCWNSEHERQTKFSDIVKWDFWRTLESGSAEWVHALWARPGFYRDLEPLEGAVESLNRLHEQGHTLLVVTSIVEGERVYADKRALMLERFPWFDTRNYFGGGNKQYVGADVLVDDGEHNVQACIDARRGSPILFERPWNRQNGIKGLHHVARDWPETMEILRQKDVLSQLVAQSEELGLYAHEIAAKPKLTWQCRCESCTNGTDVAGSYCSWCRSSSDPKRHA